jgi:transposase-like protein
MDVHKNAPLTPAGREAMVRRVVEDGQTPQAVSAAVGVCPRTVRKWADRFRAIAWAEAPKTFYSRLWGEGVVPQERGRK